MELHDEQQALVVQRLRAANGAPVSYEELRELGVENPALLGYELAAVGLPVERRRTREGTGALTLPVRPEDGGGVAWLVGAPPRGAENPGAEEQRPQGVAGRGLRRRRPGRAVASGILAGGLMLAALVVALALAPSGGPPSTKAGVSSADVRGRLWATHKPAAPGTSRRAATRDGHGVSAPTASDRDSARAADATPPVVKAKVLVSPAAAAASEAEGHQLLTSGRYAAAIGDLRNAIEASGGSLADCSQPTTEACLTYAYALYDLGRALQLDGRPAAAIPVLNERLRIDNQRELVAQELELARRASA